MQLLFKRTLKPSHGPSFTAAWTSAVLATRVSHFQPPASDSEPKTPGTSGRLSQPELLECDQVSVSLKTSRDISRWGCPTLSKTWQDWVTERRGAFSQRLKSARRTNGSGSLSWPTATTTDSSDMSPNPRPSRLATNRKTEYLARMVHWPTVCASEVRQGFQDRSRGKKGSQESLTTAVVKDAANWPTPNTMDSVGARRHGYMDDGQVRAAINPRKATLTGHSGTTLTDAIFKHGPAAPANLNTSGSRQGLSWMTPRACEAEKPPMGVDKRHQGLTHQVTKQWLTPKVPSGGGQATRTTDGGGLRKLEDQTEARANGKLNPRWVETLMGLPIGWTMPSCTSPQTIGPTNSDSSATESCLPPQSELFECLLAS